MSHIIGGSAFGRGDALIDTTDAVLLDGTSVAVIGALRQEGVETVIALELRGRVNHATERSDVLYLLNGEGAADIISQLLGVAHRANPKFLNELLERIGQLP
ncbi:hypothetical protein [Microbacterium allomyrinae]|uniref:Uncharacterized protein n=1 Tax=Microbacterium allomyrinae TaxID=2830666 RepID=A0A9X1LUB6_9MICO|nr:hypothetical protein [Microbacterium allomyrinae]MCC2031808.1 hypothetical protein [Microbacterium allomyrinae]